MSEIEFIDLFAGAGGASAGYVEAGLRCKLAVEINPVYIQSHKANHPTAEHRCIDIAASLETELWDDIRGTVDLVHGSPPCQPFSEANKGKRETRFNTELLDAFVEIVRRVRPKYWVMENVVGIWGSLDSRFPIRVKLNAAHFGLSQTRVRVFAGKFPVPIGNSNIAMSWGEAINGIGWIYTNTDKRPNRPLGQFRSADQPASTLTATGLSQWKLVQPGQEHDPLKLGRLLTIDEGKVIQGFPASYIFRGTKTQQQRQIGNAVPPALTRAIGREIVNPQPWRTIILEEI